jgi:phosphoribosylanthranilate isomerase
MVQVKICGITSYEDAAMAVEMGVNALGFIFASSPRRITPDLARDIIGVLPPFVKTVGVFVDEAPARITEVMGFCGLDLVQLHGSESPDICEKMMPLTIKAFRVKDPSSLSTIASYRGRVRAMLLDTFMEGKAGGTGKTFDWDLAVRAKALAIPIILSGGLDPSNIERAISIVRPYAVDVNSGVEEYPGKKSPVLMKELMARIRRMEHGGNIDD